MKFSDGNWMMQPGVRAHYPAEIYEVEESPGRLRLIAPTRHIGHRGDTLEGPILTLDITSPAPDVIRVQTTHFEGGPDCGPHFPLFTDPVQPRIKTDDSKVVFESGALSLEIPREGNWRIDFAANGQLLTQSPWRGMAYAQTPEGPHMLGQISLEVGECVYGLGERFTNFVKNGQVIDIWNRDGGTGSDQAYKNVPFYLTNRGYGVFVNHPENVSFEVASEKVSRVQFSVPGEKLDYFVIYGPSPKEILEKYTALTGRPALPPAWTFGLWLTTSFTTNYDEATVTEFIQGMADRDLPLHVFHFDCFWMKDFHWCDLQWDERVFPDPKGMLQRLHDRGLKVCVWINPYIAQRSRLFSEAKEKGYLLKKANGGVWQTDQWQPGMGIVDFTNPDAKAWYQGLLGELVEMGVDSFKTDFGERIPTDVVYHNGADPVGMHNYYPYLYNQAVFEVLEQKRGKGEACLFARSATAGCQQYPVHWGGDCDSKYESMAESLRGGLSLGLSGFGFWSHDIGGFEGLPPADLYKRWVAFGLMSSHSRLHGSSSYRVPWYYDDEACDVLRHFTRLKCRLMPYLYGQAVIAHQKGWPVMRAMVAEFEADPGCEAIDRQYLLGDSLLVAPVFSPDHCSFYVPQGTWIDLQSERSYQGPGWFKESFDFFSLPLLVRPNTVIPVGNLHSRPDYDYRSGVTLLVGSLDDGVTTEGNIPSPTGEWTASYSITRNGNDLIVKCSAPSWSLKVLGSEIAVGPVSEDRLKVTLS
ncbi:MAG: alpha-xylosidase [Armatimonadetes bacterium]|nr:alpha-xylosidase [Armatimonadota bacterium]